MLGLSFPPLHLEWLAFVGFVPLLFAMEGVTDYKDAFKVSYFGFLVLNIITIYWVGGWNRDADPFMMIGGAALILGHPLFFIVPMLVYHFVRKKLGRRGILIFPFLYLTFEYLHSITEIAFPWITIGYSQSYNLPDIQVASYTGLFGISLQILLVGSLLTYAVILWYENRKTVGTFMLAAAFLIVIIPEIYGVMTLAGSVNVHYSKALKVAAIQPNIDPYAKWISDPRQILMSYEKETVRVLNEKPDFVVWPETAIPFYILLPYYYNDLQTLQRFVDTTGISLLSGVPLATYYSDSTMAKPSSHYDPFMKQYYDAYNGAALFEPNVSHYQTYGKIILVPFAERVPYADDIPFLIKLFKWGVGISNWARGKDTTVFHLRNGETFSTVICYESVFPGYVREFARKGADFLVIITNDGWFGKLSGPYQHAAYAIFRAVENRRAVVRSANTGISEILDPYGRYIAGPTRLDTRTTLFARIPLVTGKTFYSEHGNWIATIAEIISGISILFALFIKFRG